MPTKSADATRYVVGKERTVKNGTISSRASIVQRSKGQSAVEQSAYISRTSLYSDYYGMTYNRTAKEDLVGAGVLLPEHAPPEFADRAVLWNSVEKNEKAKNAQLARSLKYSLPNEWDEATARQVMERFIKEQFVDKGMCADYGIHRSYNDKGQPNLHIHILLTLRPLNEDGTWGAKSRKEYVLDADGNRIPNASGKGYKSRKVNVIDWNEKGKAKEWRNAIAEVINATNEKAGIAERVDPRSYKDRGIPLIPTIHLGERASALERKGIRTERGNINRAIEKYNAMIMKIYGFISELKEELKKGVFRFVFERKNRTEKDGNQSINPSVPKQKPEVQTALEMLQKQRSEMVVRPIFPYVQRFKDKRLLGNVELLAKLIDTNHLETWEDVRAFEEKQTEVLENCRAELSELSVRYEKWTQAVSDYDDYKQYQPVMKEYQALSGLRKNSFKKKHETELENYAIYRDRVKAVMPENMKISKPYIDKQLAEVLAQQEQIQRKSSRVATDLARLSVFKGNLREIEAQQRADEQAREQNRDKKHENTI
ncbi:MobA/MobL family protein [Lachnospiraceae bacterium WCA-693-APC-MOT-I]|uniref:MobA/MobL family protein n=1 Tax=Velocimicrobium porci TaxID=2606634 RepID=A0A6L5Y0P7_9FIRM|nr:MobA/MobL family protein [Velocimicrobium porci]